MNQNTERQAPTTPYLRYFIISILCLIILLSGYFFFRHKSMLEDFLSKELNTQVTIKDTSLNYDGIYLNEVSFASSSPMKVQDIAKIKKIEVKFPIWKIFNNSLKINRLNLLGIKIYLNLKNEDGTDNTLEDFFTNLPSSQKKVFTIDAINIYSVEFEAFDDKESPINIWPIGFLYITDMKPDQSLANVTKFLLKNIEAKMISTHKLPYNAPVMHQVLPQEAKYY